MARFEEFQGRCLRTLDSKPFYHSAASCLSGYRKLDHREISWSFSEWVRLFLMWINEHDPKQKLYWFPMRRGIAMGPLFPVWPWEFEGKSKIFSLDFLTTKIFRAQSTKT